MLNPFTEYWLTATCAPDSIANVKTDLRTDIYLDAIKNEDNTIQVYVLSNDTTIIALGKDYDELVLSPTYSFKDGLKEIAKILQLTHISF